MKKLTLNLLFLGTVLFSLSACKDDDEPQIYKQMTWSEEFDGNELDTKTWSYEIGRGNNGWGNAEHQYYTSRQENCKLQDGKLIITAKHDQNYLGSGANYTSARIITRNKVDFKYGRIEARIKVPSARGVWPAFWMLPTTGGWPHGGEIDIMEVSDLNPTELHGTIHYFSGSHQFSGAKLNDGTVWSNDYHTYSVEWEPKEIRWYVDGRYYGKQTPSTTTGGAWPFDDQNFFIILNVAVGGNFTKTAPQSADYPVTMEVDYIRVYKR